MDVKKYQNLCAQRLKLIYSEVEMEWVSFPVNDAQFSPRPDLAVGPFVINDKLSINYDFLLGDSKSKKFIDLLIEKNNQNIKKMGGCDFAEFSNISYFNYNARCFMCVEIENQVSRKHIIGGLVNASALGRVGVLVAWTPDKLRAFFKLKNYLKFLSSVEKNSFKTDNILILDKDQFLESMSI